MQMLRPYLIGSHLTSWVEHKPFDPLYINTPHQSFNKHRQKVQDFSFTDMHLLGKKNPCDYKSRHPNDISDMG